MPKLFSLFSLQMVTDTNRIQHRNKPIATNENTMTPIEYIINALNAALDNAHDMGMRGGWASEAASEISASQYAISTIVDDICGGTGKGYPECGYLEVQYDVDDNEVRFTIAELRPVLTQALVAFLQSQRFITTIQP